MDERWALFPFESSGGHFSHIEPERNARGALRTWGNGSWGGWGYDLWLTGFDLWVWCADFDVG